MTVTKYYCDKCKKKITNRPFVIEIAAGNHIAYYPKKELELCEDCFVKMCEFLKLDWGNDNV